MKQVPKLEEERGKTNLKLKPEKTSLTLAITSLVILGLFQAVYMPTVFAGTPVLVAPIIANPALVPGAESFRINITVADVVKLWGFQLSISYNTTVLTAIGYGFYAPFTTILPSEINDNANATHGYIALSASSYMGDVDGLSTVDALPIAWIDFIVEDFGTTKLYFDRDYTAIVDVSGRAVQCILSDGLFSNIATEIHDVAVINVIASPTRAKVGDLVSINVTVVNQGTVTENFNVTAKYNGVKVGTQEVIDLVWGTLQTLSFGWNTSAITEGTYRISAEASVVPGETNIADNSLVNGVVTISSRKELILFDQTHGADPISWYSTWTSDLMTRGYTVDELIGGPITSSILDQCDVFVIPQAHSAYSPSELSEIQSFVIEGGGLLVIGDDSPPLYNELTSFAGIAWSDKGIGGYTSDITPHALTQQVTIAYFDSPISDLHVAPPATDLIRDNTGYVMFAASEIASGKVVAIADENSIDNGFITYGNNFQLTQNVIAWLTVKRPEHELMVTLEAPHMLRPDTSSLLEATVYNVGGNNETNVELKLLINGTTVNSTTTTNLRVDSFNTISYLWTPEVEGTYNITAYTPPALNEVEITNNKATKLAVVAEFLKAVVLDSWGTDYFTRAWPTLNAEWFKFGDMRLCIDFTSLNKENISYDDLVASGADVLIISCAYSWQFTDEEISAITQYVTEGHGLIATAGTLYYEVPNNNKLAPLFGLSKTVSWTATDTNMLDILDPTHPLFKNIPDPYLMQTRGTAIPYDYRWDLNELTSGTYVALGPYLESAIVVNNGLVFISPFVEYNPDQNDLQLLYNAITWSRYILPPAMQIQPDEGPVGAKVTIQGIRATPSADIEIYWDNTLIGETTADDNGTFLFVLTIPPSTAGSHTIAAIETASHRKGTATFDVIPSIGLNPELGSIGTKVTVNGHGFPANVQMIITFDDTFLSMWVSTDENGSFTTTLNVPVAAAGTHKIKALTYVYLPPYYRQEILYAEAEFTVVDVSPLMVKIEVGEIFFKGETAEFYVQSAFGGRPLDATLINATLYMPDGTAQKIAAQRIATGLYKIEYTIRGKGSMIGTYILVVEASYITSTINAYGTSIRAFIVKPTWEREAANMTAFSIASVGLVSAMILLWRKEKKSPL